MNRNSEENFYYYFSDFWVLDLI